MEKQQRTVPKLKRAANRAQDTGADGLYPGAPARSFREAISVCFRKYVTFSGRASRSEYWYFTLFIVVISIATTILDLTIFGAVGELSPIGTLVSLATLLPSIAVGVRRFHDIDRSGWWYVGFWLAVTGFSMIDPGAFLSTLGLWISVPLYLALACCFFFWLVFTTRTGDLHPNRFG